MAFVLEREGGTLDLGLQGLSAIDCATSTEMFPARGLAASVLLTWSVAAYTAAGGEHRDGVMFSAVV